MKALALCAVMACAVPTWKPVAAIATGALIACDYGQTLRASDLGRWDRVRLGSDGHHYAVDEANPLLGAHPSLVLLSVATAAALVLDVIGATSWSPDVVSAIGYAAIGGVETWIVASDYTDGGACGL